MTRLVILIITALFSLSACEKPAPQLGPDGKPIPRVYRIKPGDAARIQYRTLDSINALRAAEGAKPLQLNADLIAAAATHSRDMSVQNRPWHFGSDGSSPIDRVARTGYQGKFLGEDISETYENDVETLADWVKEADTREVLLNPKARDLGFAWFQEMNGKIWWTLVTGTGTAPQG